MSHPGHNTDLVDYTKVLIYKNRVRGTGITVIGLSSALDSNFEDDLITMAVVDTEISHLRSNSPG
jgi:hypothetical protein